LRQGEIQRSVQFDEVAVQQAAGLQHLGADEMFGFIAKGAEAHAVPGAQEERAQAGEQHRGGDGEIRACTVEPPAHMPPASRTSPARWLTRGGAAG
jgi:hypothetical protein